MLTGVGVAEVDVGETVVSVVEFADRVMVPFSPVVESDSVSFDALCCCPDNIVVVVIERYVPVIFPISRGSSVTGRVVTGPVIVVPAVSEISSGAASAAASISAGTVQRGRISSGNWECQAATQKTLSRVYDYDYSVDVHLFLGNFTAFTKNRRSTRSGAQEWIPGM